MSDKLTTDLLEVLVKHELVPSSVLTALRNEKIKIEYKKLRDNGRAGKEARAELADKNFLSEKQIETILYGNKK